MAAWFAASQRLEDLVATDVTTVGDGHDARISGLPRIALADDEAREIGQLYPNATILEGADGTKARVWHRSGPCCISPATRFPICSSALLENAIGA